MEALERKAPHDRMSMPLRSPSRPPRNYLPHLHHTPHCRPKSSTPLSSRRARLAGAGVGRSEEVKSNCRARGALCGDG